MSPLTPAEIEEAKALLTAYADNVMAVYGRWSATRQYSIYSARCNAIRTLLASRDALAAELERLRAQQETIAERLIDVMWKHRPDASFDDSQAGAMERQSLLANIEKEMREAVGQDFPAIVGQVERLQAALSTACAELAALKAEAAEVVRPFAKLMARDGGFYDDNYVVNTGVTMGDLRRARRFADSLKGET